MVEAQAQSGMKRYSTQKLWKQPRILRRYAPQDDTFVRWRAIWRKAIFKACAANISQR